MRAIWRVLAALLGVAGLFGPAAGGDLTPDGYWITEGQRARYYVSSCGGGGELCAVLLWIRPDLQNERNARFLNTAIFERLPRRDDRSWRGEVTLDGHTVTGVVEMVSFDEMKVTGCVFVLCDTVIMSRLPNNG